MAEPTKGADLIAERIAQLNVAGAIPMTVEEILAGQTQAGVPRPAFLADHEDDGTVERIGLRKKGDDDGTA
jgi:hypothetical protein